MIGRIVEITYGCGSSARKRSAKNGRESWIGQIIEENLVEPNKQVPAYKIKKLGKKDTEFCIVPISRVKFKSIKLK